MNNKYTTVVEQDDNGDFIITIPDPIIEELGWLPGDEIEWEIDSRNVITLTKKINKVEENDDNN